MIKKAVIPAAGLGTRFLPATKAQPKEMLPVVDKPTIQYVVEEAVNSGIEDILIITGRGKRAIEDHFDRSFELNEVLKEKGKENLLKQMEEIENLGVNIHYVRQTEQKGLGHAIMCAKQHVDGEPFAIMLGDTIIKSGTPCTKQLSDLFTRYKCSVIAVEKVPKEKLERYGIIKCSDIENGVKRVQDLVEKPKPEEAPSDLGIIGRYVLTPAIFDILKNTKPGKGGEIQLTDAMKTLLGREEMYACVLNGKRYDIGNKLDYLKAITELALERKEFKDDFKQFLSEIK